MAGQPPPYSDHHAGYLNYTAPVIEQPGGPSWSDSTFEYRHDVYLVIPPPLSDPSTQYVDQARNVSYICAIASRKANASLVCFASTPRIPAEHLGLIQGYEDRGLITVLTSAVGGDSIAKASQSNDFIYLQQDLERPGTAVSSTSHPTESSTARQARLHSFQVFAESVGLVDDAGASTDSFVYKWSKPNSVYSSPGFGLSGAWEEDLAKVLEDAFWKAGRDIKILFRRISLQQLDNLRAKWRLGTTVLHFAASTE